MGWWAVSLVVVGEAEGLAWAGFPKQAWPKISRKTEASRGAVVAGTSGAGLAEPV